MATRMLQRRGSAAEWAAANPVLGDGEVGVERDTGIVKIGDGVAAWNALTNIYRRFADAVAKAGDTMTGDLKISKNNASLQLEESVTDRLHVIADTGLQYIQVDDELRITSIGAGALKTLSAGDIYDNGNRVYSASNPQPATNPFAVVDAAGDLLVGSANDAVARLAKGANGSVLTVSSGGVVVWQTPVDASTKVSKTGDTMTGDLHLAGASGSAGGLRFNPSGTPATTDPRITGSAGVAYLRKVDGSYANFDAGAVLDNGNRVYSASNPPPESGMKVLATGGGLLTSAGSSTPTAYIETQQSFNFVAPASGKVTVISDLSRVSAAGEGVSWRITQYEAATSGSMYTGTPYPEYPNNRLMARSVRANSYSNRDSGETGIVGLTPGATYTLMPLFAFSESSSTTMGAGQGFSGPATATFTVIG